MRLDVGTHQIVDMVVESRGNTATIRIQYSSIVRIEVSLGKAGSNPGRKRAAMLVAGM
jgi:hypothetical protein